jgi:hypothetical protein
MDLRVPVRILFNRQFLPLASHGQLRRRAAGSNSQVRQDKLSELRQAQFRRDAPRLRSFHHFDPKAKGACLESGGRAKASQFQKLTGGCRLSGNPQPVDR